MRTDLGQETEINTTINFSTNQFTVTLIIFNFSGKTEKRSLFHNRREVEVNYR